MNKIEAIKAVRAVTNLGLKESKDLVEAIAPLLQMNQDELTDRIHVINNSIRDLMDIGQWITLEQVERLKNFLIERSEIERLRK